MHRIYVCVSQVERCVIRSFTTPHFIAAHRRDFVRSITAARPPRAHALSPARYAPAVIKIFKKLCTLKHFMVVAARASYDRRMHRMQPPLSPHPLFAVALSLFLSRSKSRRPDRSARSNTPSFYNPTSLMLASNF